MQVDLENANEYSHIWIYTLIPILFLSAISYLLWSFCKPFEVYYYIIPMFYFGISFLSVISQIIRGNRLSRMDFLSLAVAMTMTINALFYIGSAFTLTIWIVPILIFSVIQIRKAVA